MSATKILWGQILVVSVIVLAAIWGATQWTAWRLGYQAQLGEPWTEIAGMPVYPPPAFFLWWYWFDAYAPRIFVEGAIIASSGGFAAIAIAIGLSVWRAREAKEATTYGSARWATAPEIRKAGLLRPDGVVLGCFGRDYLRHDGPEHVLCFAPTRSGKGVGLVVPTLLTWPGSAIVHDIKGENWQLTAGWRARFARVLLFDPTNVESSAYTSEPARADVHSGPAAWTVVRDVVNGRHRMICHLQLTVTMLLASGGFISASAHSSMPSEDRWNPQHIDGLPSEVRNAISRYARVCGGPLAAEHSFARYFQKGTVKLIGLHFENVRCGNRASVCKASGCLHQVYISTGGGPYRFLSSSYVPELDLTQIKVAPPR